MKILQVFGTRPEAIKMAPVVRALDNHPSFVNKVCVTAQHRDMLDQVTSFFEIKVDHDLDIMRDAQGLADVTARVLTGLSAVLEEEKPDLVLVHGDTNTTMSAALAAFYQAIPVGHVEAGLRTYNLKSPWPEEAARQVTDRLSELCFAPTQRAASNLLQEQIDRSKIVVTGNTVVDALLMARGQIHSNSSMQETFRQRFSFLDPSKQLILVTGHRRESFGGGFRNICKGLANIASRSDVEILYPVHLNPNVKKPVHELLGPIRNIHLINPQDYPAFVYLMGRSHMILTDSGGIQEEAPSLGKPVLVMRGNTERPEAVDAGTVKLVGTDPDQLARTTAELLDDQKAYQRMARAHNPYGDGTASQKIVEAIENVYL